ncbi:MAG: hypothetical protein WC289_05765 [Patescibacteria group bacterium]|jgi:hypothetical protein
MQDFIVTHKDPWLQIQVDRFTLLFYQSDFTQSDAKWIANALFAGNPGLSPNPDPPEYGTRSGYVIGTVGNEKIWINMRWNGGNIVRFSLPRKVGKALRTTNQTKIAGFTESPLDLSEPILPKPALDTQMFPNAADGETVLQGIVGLANPLMYDFGESGYIVVRDGGSRDGEVFLLNVEQCRELVSKPVRVIKNGDSLNVIYAD